MKFHPPALGQNEAANIFLGFQWDNLLLEAGLLAVFYAPRRTSADPTAVREPSPRRPRLIAAVGFVSLQLALFATGNYCFFNLLTIVLCLPLLDDATLRRGFLTRWKIATTPGDSSAASHQRRRAGIWRFAEWTLAVVVVTLTLMEMRRRFWPLPSWPEPLEELSGAVQPFRSINSYGLFAVMTTSRRELVIEGSNDRSEWRAYELPCKPGDPKRRPSFVAPHQPRLDWQLWFAALGSAPKNPWVTNLCLRLLQGSPAVVGLFSTNPFPEHPPKYVRVLLYEYHFTTPAERAATGAWWSRELKSTYFPETSLC